MDVVKNNPLYIPIPFSKDLNARQMTAFDNENKSVIIAIRLYNIDLSRLSVTALDNVIRIMLIIVIPPIQELNLSWSSEMTYSTIKLMESLLNSINNYNITYKII